MILCQMHFQTVSRCGKKEDFEKFCSDSGFAMKQLILGGIALMSCRNNFPTTPICDSKIRLHPDSTTYPYPFM